MTKLPTLISAAELAERYGVKVKTIHVWKKKGVLPRPASPSRTNPLWHPDVIAEFERGCAGEPSAPAVSS